MGRIKIKKVISAFRKISGRGNLIIGLTGDIGSGKSTALTFFKEEGFYVVSCDDIVKKLLTTRYYCDIILSRYFFVGDSEKGINFKALADLIFNDKRARRFVEGIIHPGVISWLLKNLNKIKGQVIVVEVPLLFETGLEEAFDFTLCVTADKDTIKRRLLKRGMDIKDIEARIKAQFESSIKVKKSDAVIFNNGDIDSFRAEVKGLSRTIEMLHFNKNK